MFLAAPTRSGKGVGIVIPTCSITVTRWSCWISRRELRNYFWLPCKCGQEVHKFAPDDENFQTPAGTHWPTCAMTRVFASAT
ncbi:hypothetical protein LOK82_13620 [Xylella fastidiosa subsp. multiplex]|uniref:Uncharacterized protein n=1 Tax=Xylella fastidiosa subsp. multiplex TaxID=644357 RepID=A0AAW6HZ13_XYLFS|nr:hypothetical protein [Xylella fastidiosa subsp. multiplex]